MWREDEASSSKSPDKPSSPAAKYKPQQQLQQHHHADSSGNWLIGGQGTGGNPHRLKPSSSAYRNTPSPQKRGFLNNGNLASSQFESWGSRGMAVTAYFNRQQSQSGRAEGAGSSYDGRPPTRPGGERGQNSTRPMTAETVMGDKQTTKYRTSHSTETSTQGRQRGGTSAQEAGGVGVSGGARGTDRADVPAHRPKTTETTSSSGRGVAASSAPSSTKAHSHAHTHAGLQEGKRLSHSSRNLSMPQRSMEGVVPSGGPSERPVSSSSASSSLTRSTSLNIHPTSNSRELQSQSARPPRDARRSLDGGGGHSIPIREDAGAVAAIPVSKSVEGRPGRGGSGGAADSQMQGGSGVGVGMGASMVRDPRIASASHGERARPTAARFGARKGTPALDAANSGLRPSTTRGGGPTSGLGDCSPPPSEGGDVGYDKELTRGLFPGDSSPSPPSSPERNRPEPSNGRVVSTGAPKRGFGVRVEPSSTAEAVQKPGPNSPSNWAGTAGFAMTVDMEDSDNEQPVWSDDEDGEDGATRAWGGEGVPSPSSMAKPMSVEKALSSEGSMKEVPAEIQAKIQQTRESSCSGPSTGQAGSRGGTAPQGGQRTAVKEGQPPPRAGRSRSYQEGRGAPPKTADTSSVSRKLSSVSLGSSRTNRHSDIGSCSSEEGSGQNASGLGGYHNMSLQDYMASLVTTPASAEADSGLGDAGPRWALEAGASGADHGIFRGISDDDDEDDDEMIIPPDYVSGSSSESDSEAMPVPRYQQQAMRGGRLSNSHSSISPTSQRLNNPRSSWVSNPSSRSPSARQGGSNNNPANSPGRGASAGQPPMLRSGALEAAASSSNAFNGAGSIKGSPRHEKMKTAVHLPMEQFVQSVGNTYDLRPATSAPESGRRRAALGGGQEQQDPEEIGDLQTKETDLGGLSGALFIPKERPPTAQMRRHRGVGAGPSEEPQANETDEVAETTEGDAAGAHGLPPRVASAHGRAEGAAMARVTASQFMERPPSRQKPPPEALHLFQDGNGNNNGWDNSAQRSTNLQRPMTSSAYIRPRTARPGPTLAPTAEIVAEVNSRSKLRRPPSRQRPPPESLCLEMGPPTNSNEVYWEIFQDSSDEEDEVLYQGQ